MIARRRNHFRHLVGVLSIVAATSIVAVSAHADATIVLRQQHPVEGEAVEVFLQDGSGVGVPGADVSVTYRPGSSVEKTEVVGTTNDSGRIMWTPSTAGIASINMSWGEESASINVSVRFSSAPWLGLVIMILAGLLLVGGSAVRIGLPQEAVSLARYRDG